MAPDDPNRLTQVLNEAMRRREASQRPDIDAFRILNGPGDGAPAGLTLDSYAGYLVMSARAHVPTAVVQQWAKTAQEALDPPALVLKTLATRAQDSQSEVLFGEVPDAPIVIREGQVSLLCALNDGVQTGLFVDHRETRFLARDYVGGGQVLNLFSYTCAFSVHAAQAGASRVTSVDVSRKALDWGRANMRATGLSPDEHRWFADDVLKHVSRGPEGVYELVILDPPVFGRAKKATFSLKAHLPALLEGAFRKLANAGVLIFSTHAQTMSDRDVLNAARAAAARAGGRMSVVAQSGLPTWDHPVASMGQGDAEDRGNYLKTLVLRIEGK